VAGREMEDGGKLSRPKPGTTWQILGQWLVVTGGAVTAVFPLGVFGALLRLWTMHTAYVLSLPLVISTAMALICIEMQRRGGIRSWHLVPEPRRSLVWAASRLTVWPTVALNACRTAAGIKGEYCEEIPVVKNPGGRGRIFMGGLPYPGIASRLKHKYNVTRIINCCEESPGPIHIYAKEGIEQLRLYCIDYCDVPLERIAQGVQWMHEQLTSGHNVYVHCKAGKGRAATIVVAYLARFDFNSDAEAANKHVKERRRVAIATVHARPDLKAYLRQAAQLDSPAL